MDQVADLCIFALKEIVSKYKDHNSSVLMCFMCTRAFDLVNHIKLIFYIKMKQRGVPGYVVSVLAYCYVHPPDRVCQRNGSILAPFGVVSGRAELSIQLYLIYISII